MPPPVPPPPSPPPLPPQPEPAPPPLLHCFALHDLAPRKEPCTRYSNSSAGECHAKRVGRYPCVYRDGICRKFVHNEDTVTHCSGYERHQVHRMQRPNTTLGEQHGLRSAFIAYVSSVYRENASTFQHADLEALRASLGWVYHQAHWSYSPEVRLHSPPWLHVWCVAMYSGYPGILNLSHTDFEGGDAIFFAVPHLLSTYNAYGVMVGAGQYTCDGLRSGVGPRARRRAALLAS